MLLLVILLFKLVAKCNTAVLSNVPKCKVMMCLMQKILVLDKLHPSMHHSVVGC